MSAKIKTVPPHIVSATAIDCDTGEEQSLVTKQGSRCHFFERFSVDDFDVRLRLDWADLGDNGDPMLDADFFQPEETKPIKEMRKLRAHQTKKAVDPSSGLLSYLFSYGSKRLSLLTRFTNERTATSRLSIRLPDDK